MGGNAFGGAGGGHFLNLGQGVTVGAGVIRVGQLDIINGSGNISVRDAGASFLDQVERDLHVGGQVLFGHGQLGCAAGEVATVVFHIRFGIPDGVPGGAAVGRNLHGQGHLAVEHLTTREQIIKGQGRGLTGQVNNRRKQIFILRLVVGQGLGLVGSRLNGGLHRFAHNGLIGRLGQGLFNRCTVRRQAVGIRQRRLGHAPAAIRILVIVDVNAGLLAGVQVALRALIPGVELAVSVGGLNAPAVAGESGILKVIFKEHLVIHHRGGRKAGRDGVVVCHSGKGVLGHSADADAIHQNIRHQIAAGGGDGKGLVGTGRNGDFARRLDAAALTGRGRDGVRGAGGDAGRLQGDVIHRKNAGVVAALVHIVESELHAVDGVFLRNGNFRRAGDHIARLLVGQGILDVPDGRPGGAAVGRDLHGALIGAVLDIVIAVGVIKGQHAVFRTDQVNGGRDQVFVLILVVFPVVGNVSVVGAVEVVILVLLPSAVARGIVDALDTPAAAGEVGVLKVVVKQDGRRFRNGFKHHGYAVGLIHRRDGVAAVRFHGAAVHLDGGHTEALVRGDGDGGALSGGHRGCTGRGNGTALVGGDRQRVGAFAAAAGNRQRGVVNTCIVGIRTGPLEIVECQLHVGSLPLVGNGYGGFAGLVSAGISLGQVGGGIPDGRPGGAAILGGLDRQLHGAVEQRVAAEQVIEGQGSVLAGQIDHGRNQIFILLGAAAQAVLVVLIPIDQRLFIRGVGRKVGVAALIPGVELTAGVGGFHRPALAGEAVGAVEVVVKQRNLTAGLCDTEGGVDGMILADLLEGVIADGPHGLAVDGHVFNFIAVVCGYGKGFAGAKANQRSAGRGNAAALTGGGRHSSIVRQLIGVQHHIVNADLCAANALINKGKLQAVAVLEFFRNGDLGLGTGPVREQARFPQIPDLLPVLAVGGGHHQQVAVLVLRGVPIAGEEVEHHVHFGVHTADVRGRRVQPLVLLVVVVAVDGGGIILVTVPGLDRRALRLFRPAFRQPGIVEVFLPQNVGGGHIGIIIGVARHADNILSRVAGIVVHDHAKALAHAGDVHVLQLGSGPCGFLGKAIAVVQQRGVAQIVENDGGHILVIRHGGAQIITAFRLRYFQVGSLGFLGINGDGELPRGIFVGRGVVGKGQGGLNANRGLGVVGQAGTVFVGAIPGLNAVKVGIHTGRNNLEVVGVVNRLADIISRLAVVHRAILTGNGVGQSFGVAQQAGVNARQAVQKVVVVGRNGIAVCQIGLFKIVVVTQIRVNRLFRRAQESGVGVGLRVAGGAIERIPVVRGFDDGGLRPVAIECQERGVQVDGICQRAAVGRHLFEHSPALHISAVFKGGQLGGRVGQGDGDGDIRFAAGGYDHAVVGKVGGEGVGQLS